MRLCRLTVLLVVVVLTSGLSTACIFDLAEVVDPAVTGGAGGTSMSSGGVGGEAGQTCAFGAPAPLTEVNSTSGEGDPAVTADGLTIYFGSSRSGGSGGGDIWYATRPNVSSLFGPPTNLAEVSTSSGESDVEISADGLTLYFSSDRPGGSGGKDIWRAMRADTSAPFGTATNITELNSSGSDRDPDITADGLRIYFMSNRADGTGSNDIWLATRSSVTEPFGAPVELSELNTSGSESNASLSADELTIYYTSSMSGGLGESDNWEAMRPSVTAPFGLPSNLTTINSSDGDADPEISADGLTIYFTSSRSGGMGEVDIWVATRGCR